MGAETNSKDGSTDAVVEKVKMENSAGVVAETVKMEVQFWMQKQTVKIEVEMWQHAEIVKDEVQVWEQRWRREMKECGSRGSRDRRVARRRSKNSPY